MPTVTVDIALFVFYSLAILLGGWEARGWHDNASIEAAKVHQEAAVITKERNDQTITNGVDNDFQKQVATINLNYDAVIKRMYGIPSGTVPTIPPSSGRSIAAASTNGLPKSSQTALVNLAKNCQIQTQQLISLQEWVRKQGM